ncbi:(2Fe-2S)-binding protein [Alteribacillus iranensis]|uniref:Carbon-monoxide dehydrogenase small subunit n=1 Tax=Alteribacillus iranensis TaxID=930128 RepID=A0A1I2F190_9BACI|nr:(2Fe-2S)-binding protein [Alteribacillus iranensis]SFE98789.1 carbon-monoxide dehydrogenase small subunit [Alteribacillus iranensis]
MENSVEQPQVDANDHKVQSNRVSITLTVNGKVVNKAVEPRMLLSDFLREELDLTGTHLGCEHGVCGACTIIMNNESIRSCLMFAVQADGYDIKTVESLATNEGTLNGLQEAFSTHHALQCGFCTPGFLMTLTDYLDKNPSPTREEVREVISGNLCRCTGYSNIVDAVMDYTKNRSM